MAAKRNPTGVQRRPPKGWVDEFLRCLAACPNVRGACRFAGISKSAAYKHRQRHPSFAEKWDAALQDGIRAAEDEAWRRAVHGTVKPVFHKGKRCGSIREFDNNLLLKMLAAHKPEVYSERLRVEQTTRYRATDDLTDEECDDELRRAAGGLREV